MKKNKTANKTLEDAIMELYLSVKIRKQEEIENYHDSYEEREKEKLRKASPFTIIEYIKSSIEILIDLKVQEKLNEKEVKKSEDNFNFDDDVNEYEKLLRKLENDIRSYIKIEHQLKLHSENLQQRIDELENQKDDYRTKYKQMQEQFKRIKSKDSNEDELSQYKKEIAQLTQMVKTFEEHNLKIPELEKKLKCQKTKFEKEIKNVEDFYKDKLRGFNRKISVQDDTAKKTIFINEDDDDRVNYNSNYNSNINQNYNTVNKEQSSRHCSKIKEISRTHSPDIKQQANSHTSRIQNNNNNTSRTIDKSSDRKQDFEYVASKIDLYKKGIDKKLQENLKSVLEDPKAKKGTPLGNKSALEIERTLNTSKLKTNSDAYETINSSKTHRKMNSSAISSTSRGHSQDKSTNKGQNSKTIHSMKDNNNTAKVTKPNNTKAISQIPSSVKENLQSLHNGNGSHSNTPLNNYNTKLSNTNANNSNNSNIILNQHGVPCYNNIHIYTSGLSGISSNSKPNDISLRQYIFNKVNKPSLGSKGASNNKSAVHGRSASTAGQ